MAKIKNGILGPLSGKLGPVIGGMWKSIPYIRISAITSKKRKRSPGQIATQEKMRFINDFLVPFHSYITVGLKNEAALKTEISAAFQINYNQIFLGVYPSLSVDYSKLIFSKGTLAMLDNLKMTSSGPSTVHFTWDSIRHPQSSFDDQLIIVLYCREMQKTDGFIGGVSRSAKQCTFEFNKYFIGKTIDVYASLTSLDRKRIANNTYLGNLDPLQL